MKKNKRKILAIIPARGGSKGVPKKNIRLLAGKPLIYYTIQAAKKSKYVNLVVVSTDDKEIGKVSKQYGARVVKRPVDLARDDSPTVEAVKHCLNVLKKEEGHLSDIVVLLQPTSPLRTSQDIDDALKLFFEKDCESLISVTEACKSPYWYVNIKDNYLSPFISWDYLLNKRRQDLPKTYFLNGAIFITTSENLYKYNSFFNKKTAVYIMPSERSIDIDNLIDIKFVEFLMKEEKYGSKN